MKKRVLYITNLGLMDTLAGTQITPYLKGLADKGFKIFVMSYEKRENIKNKPFYEEVRQDLSSKGIEWIHLIYHHRWGNIFDIIVGMFKATQLVICKNIHIIHARSSIPIFIALPIAKIFRKRLLYDRRGTMAGDFADDVNDENVFSKFDIFFKVLDLVDRMIIRLSDAVIVLSERSKSILMKDDFLNKKDRYEVIPCCCDMNRFNEESKDINEEFYNLGGEANLCYLGSLGTCYLFDKMLDFFKAWKDRFKTAKFFIISQTEKDFITREIINNMLSLDDFVILKTPPDKVVYYLKLCKASVMFIKPVECKIGSSPTKFAESLAAGVPVCINKGIGDADIVIKDEKVGVLLEGFDAVSYGKAAEEMSGLFSDRMLSSRCREVAKKYFPLEMGIERYSGVYHNLSS